MQIAGVTAYVQKINAVPAKPAAGAQPRAAAAAAGMDNAGDLLATLFMATTVVGIFPSIVSAMRDAVEGIMQLVNQAKEYKEKLEAHAKELKEELEAQKEKLEAQAQGYKASVSGGGFGAFGAQATGGGFGTFGAPAAGGGFGAPAANTGAAFGAFSANTGGPFAGAQKQMIMQSGSQFGGAGEMGDAGEMGGAGEAGEMGGAGAMGADDKPQKAQNFKEEIMKKIQKIKTFFGPPRAANASGVFLDAAGQKIRSRMDKDYVMDYIGTYPLIRGEDPLQAKNMEAQKSLPGEAAAFLPTGNETQGAQSELVYWQQGWFATRTPLEQQHHYTQWLQQQQQTGRAPDLQLNSSFVVYSSAIPPRTSYPGNC